MPITTYSNMQIVREKFTQYTLERTTELSTLVRNGIATPDNVVGQLINGTPGGGALLLCRTLTRLTGKTKPLANRM